METNKIHYNQKETAQFIRQVLKKEFPYSKFSVTMDRGAMVTSVSVRYVDGPPLTAVNNAISWISGKSFDGMDDSTHYHTTELDGRQVQFSGYRPSVSRLFTDESDTLARIKTALQSACNYGDSYDAAAVIDRDLWQVLSSLDARWETPERAVTRYFAERAL
jgi:hypothetical protein